jgi:hypothetical protein
VCKKRERVKVKLADGKERTIQHMMMTSFWHPDGTPMSAQQFMELLFGKLPDFFKDEAELRAIWSAPDTRKKLLQGLAEKGFGHDQLSEMQKVIDAEKSDLFDVLAHVAYALPPVTREVRAARASVHINTRFNTKQQVFLDFVLQHYITVGVEELDGPHAVVVQGLDLIVGVTLGQLVHDRGFSLACGKSLHGLDELDRVIASKRYRRPLGLPIGAVAVRAGRGKVLGFGQSRRLSGAGCSHSQRCGRE